jgi:2-dehydropantoate 2-reductase
MLTNIIIAGVGAVGGYFGGILAKYYENSSDVKVNFLARGEHLKAIQQNGLKVIHGDKEFYTKPAMATDDASSIGIANFIIVCTKGYDLAQTIEQLKPCIDQNTVLLPLLNGVDSREVIQGLLPGNLVLDGCVYIVSRLKQPGVIENIGNLQKLVFGEANHTSNKPTQLEKLLKDASVDVVLSDSISTTMWEKFIFISPTATATSFYDKNISELMNDPDCYASVLKLIDEVQLVAKAKQVSVAANSAENVLNRLKSMPAGATSSMHSDFKSNKPQTESESLTGYVIREGKKYGIDTPTYTMMYEGLVNNNVYQTTGR